MAMIWGDLFWQNRDGQCCRGKCVVGVDGGWGVILISGEGFDVEGWLRAHFKEKIDVCGVWGVILSVWFARDGKKWLFRMLLWFFFVATLKKD